MKSAAIYARVSSDKQREERTIDSQITAIREFAVREGYGVVEEWVFRDEGYSGSLLVRPGLERLRDLASEGQLEVLLIYSPDRLSRKYAYQVLLTEEFTRHGVEVLFIKSPKATTPEEALLLQFQGMIAEYERAQIIERTRRGKRHRAKEGLVNVLSNAPYGFRYIKKTEESQAYYEIAEDEAEVVRNIFKLYTEEGRSIGSIVRWLSEKEIQTPRGGLRWARTTLWGMLKNPAYKGSACFGRREKAERQRITRLLRKRGGFSPRNNSRRERPREEWIEIQVPPIVSEETFALAAERLELNKRYASRRTIEPSLLQGILVCSQCGYSFHRRSSRTLKRKLYYYRCFGSYGYHHPNGPICDNRPIRQDYLDDVVWQQVVQILENPELIQAEIQRRVEEIQNSRPARQKKERLVQEINRIKRGQEKLLDAYQDGLLELEELRKRLPTIKKKYKALESSLNSMEAVQADQQMFLRLADNVQDFLGRLRTKAESLDVKERQKVLRLVAKEIYVGKEEIRIKHSIPISRLNNPTGITGGPKIPSCLLRSGRPSHEINQRDS